MSTPDLHSAFAALNEAAHRAVRAAVAAGHDQAAALKLTAAYTDQLVDGCAPAPVTKRPNLGPVDCDDHTVSFGPAIAKARAA